LGLKTQGKGAAAWFVFYFAMILSLVASPGLFQTTISSNYETAGKRCQQY